VAGGQVRYSKNGAVFYTSALPPAYPVRVNASLLTASATLRNVVVAAGR
jgi:hypothetical protein